MSTAATAKHDAANTPNEDLDAVKADLNQLRADLKTLLGSTVSNGKDSAKVAGQWVQAQVKEKTQATRDCVSQRPLTSLAVAGAAGLLLGLLVGRRWL